jgi:hypothetical protein
MDNIRIIPQPQHPSDRQILEQKLRQTNDALERILIINMLRGSK